MRLALMALTVLHIARAHRGNEGEAGVQKAGGMESLEMLPRGAARKVGAHKFHESAPRSLVEKSSSSKLDSELGSSDNMPLPQITSVSPQGGEHGPKITIEYPYESWANGAPNSESKGGSISVTLPQEGSSSSSGPGLQMSTAPVAPGRAAPTSRQSDKTVAWVGKDFAGLFSKVPYTVIRIQTIVSDVNWFEPYQQAPDAEYTGTGMAVSLGGVSDPTSSDPIFVTNAHVVRNAHDVQIQLPALGQQFFGAHVPLICDEFDLAVIRLDDPAAFLKALEKTEGKQLVPLPVIDYPLMMGLEVASVGFPLGSTSMKLSRGVISGTEEVGSFICYQTTAPISPGSSGGPLFALDDTGVLRIIGATFASSAQKQAQNINFVVPAIAIIQVLDQYKKQKELFQAMPASPAAAQSGGNKQHPFDARFLEKASAMPHFQFNIAPIDAVGIEGNEALYDTYGCKSGILISKILPTSVFNQATPVLKEKTFLIAVDGVPIDGFGMGRTAAFLHDPTPFESLMMTKVRPGDTVELTTCEAGDASKKAVKHKLSMQWDKKLYRLGIHSVVEPFFEKEALEYEIFAGITVMELSVNHIIRLLAVGQSPTLGRWLLPENQAQPRLLVTHLQEGSYASRVISPGMVIAKINDKTIGTLKEYRDLKVFIPEQKKKGWTWTMETDRGIIFATNFQHSLIQQIEMGQKGRTFLFTDAVVRAAELLMAAEKAHEKELPNKSGIPGHQVLPVTPGKPVVPGHKLAKDLAHETASATVNAPAAKASLAETFSTGNLASFPTVPPERVTRLAKIQALLSSVSVGEGDEDLQAEKMRRRARVAQSGFLTLPASEYVSDESLELKLPYSSW